MGEGSHDLSFQIIRILEDLLIELHEPGAIDRDEIVLRELEEVDVTLRLVELLVDVGYAQKEQSVLNLFPSLGWIPCHNSSFK